MEISRGISLLFVIEPNLLVKHYTKNRLAGLQTDICAFDIVYYFIRYCSISND